MTNFVGHGRTTVTDPHELTPVDDWVAEIVRALAPPRRTTMPTAEAAGLVLVRPVDAAEPLPPFTNSAMDGWAVVADDLEDASGDDPVVLTDGGAVHAGPVGSRPTVTPGTAVAVMTGAPVPPGADAVVPVELTSRHAEGVAFHASPSPRENVRAAGEELARGTRLLPARHRLTARDVGLLLSTGVDEVVVAARPRVSVVTTGNELVPAGRDLEPGQIRDSNGPMLAAVVTELGCVATLAGPVRDTVEDLVRVLREQATDADMVVLSGGVSAGAADHVATAIGRLGEVRRTKLAMQPGMPQALGRIDGTPIVALPGNPVSTFVSFEVLVRPALRILQGRTDLLRPRTTATLDEAVTSPAGKRSYLRVRLRQVDGVWHARPAGGQGSHMLGALSRADALAEIPVDVTRLDPGRQVVVQLLVS